jgi:hypothetical protein
LDSLAFATSIVSIGNLAILSAATLAFARSWPRLNGSFPYMALHHPATHVANDHFLQTAFFFITMAAAYLGWRVLLNPPRTFGALVVASGAVVLPFTVARAFVAALDWGTEEHLQSEKRRVEAGKARAILIRAGGQEEKDAAKRLNDERLKIIKKRFETTQRRSKILALYVPAVLNGAFNRVFPEVPHDSGSSSHR